MTTSAHPAAARQDASFAATLMKQIEDFYVRLKTQCRFSQMIDEGTLNVDHVAAWLHNTHYLIFHTPMHMKTAVELSQRPDGRFPELHAYFSAHAAEEVDHHVWAENDLRLLERESRLEAGDKLVAPKMRELVAYVHARIKEDVALYLPYILYAEYLSVVAVGETVARRKERCGIPPEALSVFTYHAELDQGHSSEDGEIIDGVVAKAPEYRERFPEVIATASQLYFDFLESLVVEAREPELGAA